MATMAEQAETATRKKRVLTPKQSRRRSKITREVRPWLAAIGLHTGPRTESGKRRSRANSLKHGRRDARGCVTIGFLANMRRLIQFLDVISSIDSGVPPRWSCFLDHATVADFWVAVARAKLVTAMPDRECGDPQPWTRVLREYQRLGKPESLAEVAPEGCSPEIGGLPILEVLSEARA